MYATENYPEAPIALAVIVATRQLWAASRLGRGHAIAFGLAIAVLPWLHVRAWPFAIVLAFFALLVWRPWPARVAAIGPLVVGTLGYIWINDMTFGRLLLTPVLMWGRRLTTPYSRLRIFRSS